MSDQYLEAAAKVFTRLEREPDGNDRTPELEATRRIVEAWVGDRVLYEVRVSVTEGVPS